MTVAIGWAFAAYALLTGIYLILENRRPQEPWPGCLRFSSPRHWIIRLRSIRAEPEGFRQAEQAPRTGSRSERRPLLSPILSRQDAEIAHLEGDSASRRKLMMLVRRNSHSALTGRNRVEILQDAAAFYPRLMEDMKAARHSIHLQYFIWARDLHRGAEADPDRQGQGRRRGPAALRSARVSGACEPRATSGSCGRPGSHGALPRRSGGCTRSATATTARSPSSTARSATRAA